MSRSGRGEGCNRPAGFCPRDVMEHGDQGRLLQVAKAPGGALGEHEPVVPVSQSVLYSPELGKELIALRRLWSELSEVAGALGENPVLV